MGGTKFFVLQMKDIIKTAVFVLIGLGLLILLLFFFLPRQDKDTDNPASSSMYIPGTYTAAIILNDRPVDIIVTVSENEITAVEMSELEESQRLFYPLFEQAMLCVSDEILTFQTTDIEIVNDYPVTTGILQKAVETALAQAIIEE